MNDLETTAMARATEFRRELGLGEYEPLDLFKLLRECLDISLVFKPLSPAVSGVFLRLGQSAVIMLNTNKTLGHQRFTAAHEYCHLRYHRGLSRRICVAGLFNQDNASEREADYFAANLLMPAGGIALRLHKRGRGRKDVSLEDVIDLEQHYGMSHRATLIRLRHLGYLTQKQAEAMGDGVIAMARRLGYRPDLYLPTREDRIESGYAEKAKRALDRGLITKGRYEQLLLEAGYADLLYEDEEGSDEDI
ncbi:MAG: ImmA/IrrE family metallo-endopeptidase [Firmicutes bacterium]|nr:ImmA/IrrE family metallo-endopeptidase [Bacillota bacterium]